MANPTRWKFSRRIVAAAAGAHDLYAPLSPGDVLNLRQLRVSPSAACEVVVYWTSTGVAPATAAAIPEGDIAFGATYAAAGGAIPDLGCLGTWPDSPGDRLRVYISAAATVTISGEGVTE